MPILTQKALVLVKEETTFGTDAAPTAAADSLLVTDPVFSVDANVLERNFARPDFSQYASVVGRKLASVSFSIQMHGSGTADTAPIWARLLEACAMARTTVTAAVGPPVVDGGVRFSPVTSSQKSVTIHLYYEGLLHRMTGVMGTFTISAEAGGNPVINFTMTGNYNTPTDSTFPASPVFEDVVSPVVELAQLAYGGDSSLVVNAFNMDMGNTVTPRSDVNSGDGYRGVRISGRNTTGGIDPEVEENHTFWSQMTASTLAAFTMTIGQNPGNKIVFAAPKTQIVGVGYGDRENLRTYDLSLAFRRNAGNDEFTVFFS